MTESNIEKYLGIIDLNETDFTDDEILEIIELYLKQKPYLEGDTDEDLEIFESSGEDDPFIDEPYFFNEIHAKHYMVNLDKIRNKYGKNLVKDLSKEKLDFREIITIFTFIDRANRHVGHGSDNDCEVWLNLLSRMEEIKNELKD